MVWILHALGKFESDWVTFDRPIEFVYLIVDWNISVVVYTYTIYERLCSCTRYSQASDIVRRFSLFSHSSGIRCFGYPDWVKCRSWGGQLMVSSSG